MKTVSAVVPSTDMADALRQVLVGATPQFSLGIDVAAMAAFLAILSVPSPCRLEAGGPRGYGCPSSAHE
jgi:hypothetical protein